MITGEITNLEEDMIEVKTTDGDILYFNFNYQGIPDEYPIETFEIRPAIKTETPSRSDELFIEDEVEEGFDKKMF